MTTVIEKCKHILTQQELREKADSLARKMGETDILHEQKKEINGHIKSDIDRLTNETKALALAVVSGAEYRDTECVVEMDFGKSEVRVSRLDTGEILRARTMTSAEKQGELALEVEEDVGLPSQHLHIKKDKKEVDEKSDGTFLRPEKKLEIVKKMTAEAEQHQNGTVKIGRALPPSVHKQKK